MQMGWRALIVILWGLYIINASPPITEAKVFLIFRNVQILALFSITKLNLPDSRLGGNFTEDNECIWRGVVEEKVKSKCIQK